MAKKLLDQLREVLRLKHDFYRTEQAYLDGVRRFLLFHDQRHPAEMGAPEIQAFLAHLAVEGNVSASTQNQALSAILFLYREVLHKEIDPVLLPLAKRPHRPHPGRGPPPPGPPGRRLQVNGATPLRFWPAPDGVRPPAHPGRGF
jgi:site-specific recombinase XerD